jgi:LuxR family maltose regulon positive regulatory protein
MWTSEQPIWLTQTKLQPPLPRSDVIPRPRLLAALRDGLTSRRLTLLSAPAGYGKTTLLADCGLRIVDCGFDRHSPAPIRHPPSAIRHQMAWLTLDEGDNDPALFLAYLVAALRRLNPACGATAQTLLSDLPDPGAQARRLVGVLVNDVMETLPDPFALVLDDLHLITEPTVYIALDYLLAHLPPQMHLGIATRHDPPLALARLRARGQLAELRAPDLRFTSDEATAFLNETLRLGLSSDDLVALQSRTEGWAVGLRLLSGSLDRIPTPAGRAAFIAHLAHTDRYVFDFLADEVLSRQSEAVRTFLLETSILPELTAPLCNAVTGRTDAAAILDDLDRRSLFITLVSSSQFPNFPIYQYHALFAEFLRQRLQHEMPERGAELHRRAAQAQTIPDRAIAHYLAAQMWEEATQAIEQVGGGLIAQGLLPTLLGWLRALPEASLDASPQLLYLLGTSISYQGDVKSGQGYLERAFKGFAANNDPAGQGEALAQLVFCASMQSDFERSHALSQRALAFPLSSSSRVQILAERAFVALTTGHADRAATDFEAIWDIVRPIRDPEQLFHLLLYLNPLLALLPGGVKRLERLCRRMSVNLEQQSLFFQQIMTGFWSLVHLWHGQLAQSIQAGEQSLALGERLGERVIVDLDVVLALASAYAAQGKYAVALRYLSLIFEGIKQATLSPAIVSLLLYAQGRALCFQGDLDEAGRVCRQLEALGESTESHTADVLCAMLHGLLALAGGDHRRAEESLRAAVALQRDPSLSEWVGNACLLLAHLYLEMGRADDALAEFVPVLARHRREHSPGFILQEGPLIVPLLHLAVQRQGVHAPFAARLLNIMGVTPLKPPSRGRPQPVRVPETGETLTPREVEVLRLIVAGASNRAIAEQLVISESTVKSHVYHIFHKLDVSSRTQAAARARELGMKI